MWERREYTFLHSNLDFEVDSNRLVFQGWLKFETGQKNDYLHIHNGSNSLRASKKKLFHDSKSERISLHGFKWFKYAYKNNHKYRKISIIFQLYIHLYNNRCLVWSVCFVLAVVFFSIWPLSIYYLLGAESECNEPWQSSYTYSFTL